MLLSMGLCAKSLRIAAHDVCAWGDVCSAVQVVGASAQRPIICLLGIGVACCSLVPLLAVLPWGATSMIQDAYATSTDPLFYEAAPLPLTFGGRVRRTSAAAAAALGPHTGPSQRKGDLDSSQGLTGGIRTPHRGSHDTWGIWTPPKGPHRALDSSQRLTGGVLGSSQRLTWGDL